MGYELCGCNNNPGPSSETSLVNILIYNKGLLQAPGKNETINNNPIKPDIEVNTPIRTTNDNISISQNDLKSVNSQNNKTLRAIQDKEVSEKYYKILIIVSKPKKI